MLREDVADVLRREPIAPALRHGHKDGAALHAGNSVQIEEKTEFGTAGLRRTLIAAAARVSRNVGDEKPSWCDAGFLEFRSQASPVAKQVLTWQHELKDPRSGIFGGIFARLLLRESCG